MTRQEAEKIVGRGMYPGNSQLNFSVAGFVDLMDKLGVLKLDVPKRMSAHEIIQFNLSPGQEAGQILRMLDENGYKIVDK